MSIRKRYQTDCPNKNCDKVVELSIPQKLRAEQNQLLCQCSHCLDLFIPCPSDITRIPERADEASLNHDLHGPHFRPQNGLSTYQPPKWFGNDRGMSN